MSIWDVILGCTPQRSEGKQGDIEVVATVGTMDAADESEELFVQLKLRFGLSMVVEPEGLLVNLSGQ